jgi:hypothetical protein
VKASEVANTWQMKKFMGLPVPGAETSGVFFALFCAVKNFHQQSVGEHKLQC